MSESHIPPGTKAEILRAVLTERWPKHALPAIASRYGITFDVLRQVIDAAGYPDTDKMRLAVANYDAMSEALGHAQAAVDRVQHDLAQHAAEPAEENLGGSQGSSTYKDLQPNDDTEPTGRLTLVRVDDLETDPGNLRPLPMLDDPDIAELADSIAASGLQQPIVARRDGLRLVVVMGHRRLTAVRRLKWSTVECIVRGPMADDEVLAAMLIENGQRKDLDPISEARGLKRLQTIMDCTEAELGRRIGRSGVFVRSRILLLSLSVEEQDRIRSGELTIGAAGHKAAIDSGRIGPKGVDRNWHLGPTHELGEKVRNRCKRLGHSAARKVGGMGCGECWEVVIRGDERQHLHETGTRRGECPVCEQPLELLADTNAASA